jgi:hypothetical protein
LKWGCSTIERATQVRWLTIQMHLQLTFREKHRVPISSATAANTTPPPKSKADFQYVHRHRQSAEIYKRRPGRSPP